ncbi:hypothetical protein KSD_76980 [Ktedonobacter sp. SOSP1-85]|nr:hypothetical protein KSD_76980 [Ktedonobacter sp. SOSP1-85]
MFYGADGEYTRVEAEWNVPCIQPDPRNTSHKPEASSIWVGLGGVVNSNHLVQAGTTQDISYDAQGHAHTRYYAWFANQGFSNPRDKEDKKVLDETIVHCGDHMIARVEGPNSLYIRDVTQNRERGPVSAGPDSDQRTAELIVERPKRGGPSYLANFQQTTLSQCKVFSTKVRGELHLGQFAGIPTQWTMVIDRQHDPRPMVEVLPVRESDSSFTVKWLLSGL